MLVMIGLLTEACEYFSLIRNLRGFGIKPYLEVLVFYFHLNQNL